MRLLAVFATTCLLVACTPERPAVAPSPAGGDAASDASAAAETVSRARLRLGPVADGAIGPLVIDDGARTAMVLASPLGEGRFRIELAIEGEGPALVRTVAETLQAPRGFSLALGARGGLLAWIEGEKRNALVSTVALAADGAPVAGTRRMPQGRVEPYWVAARVDGGQRSVIVAEQDATGALLRVRALGDDGEPIAAPATFARGAVAWTTHPEVPIATVRAAARGRLDGPRGEAWEAGREARVELLDPRAKEPILAAAPLSDVAPTAVRRVDLAGSGADLVVAVSVSEPRREVLFLRNLPNKKGSTLTVVARSEGQVVAADVASAQPAFLVVKAFPSTENVPELALVRIEGARVSERVLPQAVAPRGMGALPASIASDESGASLVAIGDEVERASLIHIGADGVVERRTLDLGVGGAWNVRLRAGAPRATRFEVRGAAVDVVDGPLASVAVTSLGEARPVVEGIVTHLATGTARIAGALLADTTFVVRLEPSSAEPNEADVNAESLRLVALGDRGPTSDDRVTDRAQPTGSITVAARNGADAGLVVAWLARERGVQQAHALVLDAKACKVQSCDPSGVTWPLGRKKHRQITKAGGDVTEVVLVPTPEGYVGAWIEQAGREAVVVAATYDAALERTSKFERVSVPGSLATDLVAAARGNGVWIGWIEGKGGRAEDPRAVPTLARVAVHDARIEVKPRALTPRAGEGLAGALALASHEAGVLAAYLEREGLEAARRADEAEDAPAFLTLQLVDDRGEPIGDAVQRGGDGEGVPCDVALSATTFALERCRPASFTLEAATIVVNKEGVSIADERTIARGLRPATQDRPLAVDERRVLWLQNDEAGNPWLRSFPLEARRKRAADQK